MVQLGNIDRMEFAPASSEKVSSIVQDRCLLKRDFAVDIRPNVARQEFDLAYE